MSMDWYSADLGMASIGSSRWIPSNSTSHYDHFLKTYFDYETSCKSWMYWLSYLTCEKFWRIVHPTIVEHVRLWHNAISLRSYLWLGWTTSLRNAQNQALKDRRIIRLLYKSSANLRCIESKVWRLHVAKPWASSIIRRYWIALVSCC